MCPPASYCRHWPLFSLVISAGVAVVGCEKPLARQTSAQIRVRPARGMASFACLLSAIGFIVYTLFQLGVEGYAQNWTLSRYD